MGSSNSFSESSGNVKSWTWTNTFSYSGIIGKYHSLHALIGAEIINNYSRENGGQAFNLPFTNPSYWLLTNGDPLTKTNYSIASTTKLQSFFTQIEYGFKERYFITGTLRNDGSSVFGPENRYGLPGRYCHKNLFYPNCPSA